MVVIFLEIIAIIFREKNEKSEGLMFLMFLVFLPKVLSDLVSSKRKEKRVGLIF